MKQHKYGPKLSAQQLEELDAWDRKAVELGNAKQFALKFGVTDSAICVARRVLRKKRAQQVPA